MNFLLSCLKGIALGAGAILPGISSGVLCVIFGIYEKLVSSILEFFKDVRANTKFLFPILLGIGIGVILFGNILRVLFDTFPVPTKCIFLGLILGSIPSLFHTANQGKGFRLHYLIYTLSTFFLAVFLLLLEHSLTDLGSGSVGFTFLILSGFIMSIGVVVPGVSSSVLLMILGVYDIYLSAVSSINLVILVPMGIGLCIGGIIFLNMTNYCLKRFTSQTYYAIIGFVLGSVLILCPSFNFDCNLFIGIICLIVSFFVAYQLEHIK